MKFDKWLDNFVRDYNRRFKTKKNKKTLTRMALRYYYDKLFPRYVYPGNILDNGFKKIIYAKFKTKCQR